uniref:F-box domain-containing protein n=1 Tax=Tetradesmus obliquus TaxID=3088 RepID=A0A383VAJ9_TETOB|eukprot:jgi/Sobl393_1/17172/SZX61769.1
MDEVLQIVKLCFPRLTPKDMCMLRCSCSELAGMSVSWQDHSINFKLDGSDSATCWLQKNIESMRKLSLNISGDVPQTALQDVMEAGRNLTCLSISSKNITELPPLSPKLEQLKLESCSALLTLPVLPQTLRELDCQSCDALEVLPSSLSSTAVCKLTCGNCPLLKSLPQLPKSLVELKMKWCGSLLQLPALPEGLKCLYTAGCEALEERMQGPAAAARAAATCAGATVDKLLHCIEAAARAANSLEGFPMARLQQPAAAA